MSRTCRWIGLAVALAGLLLSSAPLRVRAQPRPAPPVPAGKTVDRPKDDPRFTDDVTIPTDRESKGLIQAAQDYIKKKEWRIACGLYLQELSPGRFIERARGNLHRHRIVA